MFVEIEIEEVSRGIRKFQAEITSEDAELAELLKSVAEKSEIPVEELVLDLGVGAIQFAPNSKVRECILHGHRWHHHRVCIDLHFESEQATHYFPARATWALVHKWGCRNFDVPQGACANLELHKGSASGPVLNDNSKIGQHEGCELVWLVKPGPEPYGG